MSPVVLGTDELVHLVKRNSTAGGGKPTDPNGLVLEGWAQGFMVGSLIVMSCITMANMRKGVLLHKLILIELLLGIWHGFWILLNPPAYGWWLSISAIFLNTSWSLHNVIAWMKIKPFLSRIASTVFIGTVILVQPYWVVEIYANFAYFHNINDVFLKTRPWEALCRDPWWIFTTVALLYFIKSRYELRLWEILRISPRFGVMLAAMLISIVFIVLDVLSVTDALKSSLPTGINPFWKLSMVFKCLTDSVILDDFKTALDRLRAFKISHMGSFSVDNSDRRSRNNGQLENAWARTKTPSSSQVVPNPDTENNRSQWKFPFSPQAQNGTTFQIPSPRDHSSDRGSDAPGPVHTRSPKDTGLPRPPPHDSWLESRGATPEDEYGHAMKSLPSSPHYENS